MKTVYLCGPINGCNDRDAKDWRNLVAKRLGTKFLFLDPMRRDYRGRELEPGIAQTIVDGDKEDLAASDILLAYCPKPSVGTSMEIFLFYPRPVIIVHPDPRPSPWLIVHSTHIVDNFTKALRILRKMA